jgi:hypothetical protein
LLLPSGQGLARTIKACVPNRREQDRRISAIGDFQEFSGSRLGQVGCGHLMQR